ncbi:MAG: hypothetical protein V5A37_07515 [Halobacteriales archaeon]
MAHAFTADEVAGVADLFGALPRSALRRALVELGYRRGEEVDEEAASAAIEDARTAYALLAVDEDPELLAPGPGAFPDLPNGADDLPHILDADRRTLDRGRIADAAERRFRGDLAQALDDGDDERLRQLLEVSYDLEAWGPIDVSDGRDAIDDAL